MSDLGVTAGISSWLVVYLVAGAISVMALCAVLYRIGDAAAACPVSGPAAHVATLGVMGAFAAIGLGFVAIIGAVSASIEAPPFIAALGQYGAASTILGVSFGVAASTLREALSHALRERLAAARLTEAPAAA